MILYLFNGLLLTVNASSWKKAADIIAKATLAEPQVQAAATAESQNLQSLPLSALSVDDSRPPQVTYEPQQPIATSTPRATSIESPEVFTEAYRQILPGMSARLYPTLVADIVAKVTPAIPQAPAAAMAESQNLQSLLLSTLSVDDSRPPQVTYEPQQPIATSTPKATPEISTEAYHQIPPGMSARLYPTLVAC